MPAKLRMLLLLLGAGLMLLPFWVMLVTSVSSLQAVFQTHGTLLWPTGSVTEILTQASQNYGRLFAQLPMAHYFLNSLLVASLTTLGHVLLATMAGYAFARFNFAAKTPLFFVFLATLMIPPQVNIVPLFFLMKQLGWLDTYWALIVPGLFGGFGVFLMRQWFMGFPKELEEAAALDGCSPWQTFWRIALPLAMPALSALALFVFIGSWNSFMWPLIAVQTESLRTLPLGLAALKSTYRDVMDWPVLMAGSTVCVLPVIGVFLLGQRQFMQGLLMGGVKE